MKPVRFLSEARKEFLAQVALYTEESDGLGQRFREEVESSIAFSLSFPNAGSKFTRSTRRVQLRKFPFSVVYRSTEKELLIIAVAHNSRRPGYWISRV